MYYKIGINFEGNVTKMIAKFQSFAITNFSSIVFVGSLGIWVFESNISSKK